MEKFLVRGMLTLSHPKHFKDVDDDPLVFRSPEARNEVDGFEQRILRAQGRAEVGRRPAVPGLSYCRTLSVSVGILYIEF